MTILSIDRCVRRRAVTHSLAVLVLVVTGCSGMSSKPVPPSDVLDLYAATYGALPSTGAAPPVAPSPVGEPAPESTAPGDGVSATPDPTTPFDAAPAPATDESAALSPADEDGAPPSDANTPEMTTASAATPAPEPPEIDARPSDLFGLDEAGITALLGPTHYTRNEAPARVLQYAGRACVLDLFLYPDGPDGTMRTVYFEMRPTGDAPVPSGCFTGLVLAARGY